MGKRIQWTFLKQFHSKTVALGVYDYVYVGVSAQSDPKRVAFLGGHARAKADTQSGGNMQEYSCCSS